MDEIHLHSLGDDRESLGEVWASLYVSSAGKVWGVQARARVLGFSDFGLEQRKVIRVCQALHNNSVIKVRFVMSYYYTTPAAR